MEWYKVENEELVDSPGLLIYKERVKSNIDKMVSSVDHIGRLIPHIKTNKMGEVINMLGEAGIKQVKTATIAEAELAATAGMDFVLIAHQLVGPKIKRFFQLKEAFPSCEFATIVDDKDIVQQVSAEAEATGLVVSVFLDVNNGMNRSGLELDSALTFYQSLYRTPFVLCKGLHVYDGHHGQPEISDRKSAIMTSFSEVESLAKDIENVGLPKPTIIAGGSPAFSVHRDVTDRIVSPGTTILWDWGYHEKCREQSYDFAALVLTRVISKPTSGIITVDLGHKAIAAENPIHNRVRFLNLGNYELISQSEEHGVIKTDEWDRIKVGDCFYGIPFHVCPTVNLYDRAHIIENRAWTQTWQVKARDRCITI